ncbi:MAG: hypothetical protein MJ052_04275 [Sphaerochaetaceae bacterium]|nr:hypothetical protein [Sphaerochaetaceae bacterium]
MEQRKGNPGVNVVVSIVLSVLLARLAGGNMFFTVPLLLVAQHITDRKKAVLPFFASALAVSLLFILRVMQQDEAKFTGMFFLGLLFPVSAALGCALWTFLRDFSDSVLRKLVICSLVPAVFCGTFALWLTTSGGAQVLEEIREAYMALLPAELLGINTEGFAKMIATVLLMMIFPMGILFQAVPILVTETVLHRFDEKWQYGFANMKMPGFFVWILMGSWIVTMLGNIAFTYPEVVSVFCWNISIGLSMHYFLNGISIMIARIRRSAAVTAGKVLVWIALALIVPGVNAVVISVLTVMGVLETWIKLR